MDINNVYEGYAGFVLGLRVAESVLQGELGYRCDEILEHLEAFARGDVLASPSDDALIRRFRLSQNDEQFSGGCHPVLATAAQFVLDWHRKHQGPTTNR
jgi:hypothetical protein